MGKYLETTVLILGWCFGLSLLWAWLCALARSYLPVPIRAADVSRDALIPGVALGSLALVLAHALFGVNLIFPLHFFSDWLTLTRAAFAPGMVLLLASGLGSSVWRLATEEHRVWSGKLFVRVAEAMGRDPRRVLRRVVFVRVTTESWSRCLPWVFGELIVVECVFNAPGLGLDAWHLARQRDLEGLAWAVASMAGVYLVCVAASATVSRWLGRRLATYA